MPTTNEIKHCANCGAEASKRCLGCIDAPEYHDGDATETVYCNPDCQRKNWPTHKPRCLQLKKRIMLSRIGYLMKAAVIAYQSCAFSVNLTAMEMRDGTLWLTFGPFGNPGIAAFPENLTTDENLRETALLNNQCMAALYLGAPLARHLFPGKKITLPLKWLAWLIRR